MRQKINHYFFYFLLPILLIVVGLVSLFNYLKAGEFGITNLDVRGTASELSFSRSGELLAGDVIRGSFHSAYPNLGLISIRFYNQNRDSNDTLIFRLKESGQKTWYYQAKYKTDQFLPHKHFPFGFPLISDSSGKDYLFEIESASGATGSGILIDYQNPVFVAKSTFNKSELFKNKSELLYFLTNKFINIFYDFDVRFNIFFFFMPLILYLVFIIFKSLNYQFLIFIVLALIAWDIFYLKSNYDFLYLSSLFYWGLISYHYRFESRIAATFALLYLLFTPFLLIINRDILAERAAIWAYLFLCITVAQQIYELKRKPTKLLTLHDFYTKYRKLYFERDNILKK